MNCNFKNSCQRYLKGQCDAIDFCQKEYRITTLLNEALLTPKQQLEVNLRLTVDNDCDEGAYDQLSNYKKNIEDFVNKGTNIYIYSSKPGNGKTSWAIKLLIQYISKIWYKSDLTCKGLFINVPRFLLSLKSFISDKSDRYIPHIKGNVLDADVVVWDDIATKSMTEYETENLLSIINARLDNGKCNIFTSNINPNELNVYLGDRLASRVSHQSIQIKFDGQDMRGMQIDSVTNN